MTPEKEKALKDEAAMKYPYNKTLDWDIGLRENDKGWKDAFRKVYIAGRTDEAEKNESNAVLVMALEKINQMSDSGSAETTMLRMKEIAAEALKQYKG